MRRRMPLVTFATFAFLTQCAEHDPARRFASSHVSTSTSDADAAAALISQYRAAHGLPPVSVDPRLTAAASAQARTVAEAGTLSHGRFASRMDAFGIGGASAEKPSAGARPGGRGVARRAASPGRKQKPLLSGGPRVCLA